MHEFFNYLPKLDLDCLLLGVLEKKGSGAVANGTAGEATRLQHFKHYVVSLGNNKSKHRSI